MFPHVVLSVFAACSPTLVNKCRRATLFYNELVQQHTYFVRIHTFVFNNFIFFTVLKQTKNNNVVHSHFSQGILCKFDLYKGKTVKSF